MTDYFKRKKQGQQVIKSMLKGSEKPLYLSEILFTVDDQTQLGATFVKRYLQLLEETGHIKSKDDVFEWIHKEADTKETEAA